MLAFAQFALLRMSATETPACFALDVVADRVECPVYTEVSIPAALSTAFSQFEMVDVATGLWGDTVLRRSLPEFESVLQALVAAR